MQSDLADRFLAVYKGEKEPGINRQDVDWLFSTDTRVLLADPSRLQSALLSVWLLPQTLDYIEFKHHALRIAAGCLTHKKS